MRFRDKPFEERQTEYNKICQKYKDKIPVIVEPYDGKTTTTKFLVDESVPFCEFMFEVRKKLQLKPEQSLFLTVNGTMVPSMDTLEMIHAKYAYLDGFLYVNYSFENTFG